MLFRDRETTREEQRRGGYERGERSRSTRLENQTDGKTLNILDTHRTAARQEKRAKSKEQRAKSKEQRAKRKEKREKRKEKREKRQEQRAKRKEKREKRREKGEGRKERGERRKEKGERRKEKGERRKRKRTPPDTQTVESSTCASFLDALELANTMKLKAHVPLRDRERGLRVFAFVSMWLCRFVYGCIFVCMCPCVLMCRSGEVEVKK